MSNDPESAPAGSPAAPKSGMLAEVRYSLPEMLAEILTEKD